MEGDSALGTAGDARDKRFQAVLPVRGKILNVLGAKNDRIWANNEIEAILVAMGGRKEAVGKRVMASLAANERRYGKIVILTDADTDGAHICNLLLGMFHELFPTLVAEGRIFVARPPLFKINLDAKGEKFVYAYDEAERSTVVKKHNRKGEDVSRFKGLGEMPWEHLKSTCFDPATRKLQQVTVEDISEAAATLNLIMGNGPAAAGKRRSWLEDVGLRGLVMSTNGDDPELFDAQETPLPVDPDDTDGSGRRRNGDVAQFRVGRRTGRLLRRHARPGPGLRQLRHHSRAIPDVRDGLKPVQRRIIVAMDDLGLRSDRKYSKSAKTVGTVIGNYHPHGDTAVYDAMVRMAQPWQSNLPLIDGQGNWGNLNNEAPAAAQRYTESRLAAPASDFLSDLRPEVVDYEWNFDETRQMPSVLPVTFPNLLVNGSMGVAWAMACSIPPHNTAEVLSAALLVLDDPDVSIDKLLKVMPGPDLPGGGIVVNPDNLRSIYETGRGTVVVQGRIEQLPGQQTLRITELPYQVSAKSIVEQAVQGAKDGKITEIFTAELPKNLTDAAGVDVQVKCKRGGSIDKLTQELLQHTKLRDTLAFNLTVLVDGAPQTLSLRAILQHFVELPPSGCHPAARTRTRRPSQAPSSAPGRAGRRRCDRPGGADHPDRR